MAAAPVADRVVPCPLGLSAAGYAHACHALGLPGGLVGARDRYAALHRAGVAPAVGPRLALPAIGRTLTSPSPEGDVLKFTLLVPRRHPNDARPAGLPLAADTVEIESVLIPMVGKKRRRTYTLCVSSQVGCAMGCGFCQTAQMGLIRSLTAGEIVGQWYAARHLLQRPDPHAPITNIVFMGMGEPTDNLGEVIHAIEILTDRRGPGIAMGKITVSTVGRVEGIRVLAERVRTPGWHRLGLAVSLNAPDDTVRSVLMPVNRSAPLAALRAALVEWPIYGGAHLCIEYVLIPGITNTPGAAAAVASFMLGRAFAPAQQALGSPGGGLSGPPVYAGPPLVGLVNVIPYNPRDGSPWPAPSEPDVEAFIAELAGHGVYVKRRRTKGRGTMAACGQLGNPELRRASTALVARA